MSWAFKLKCCFLHFVETFIDVYVFISKFVQKILHFLAKTTGLGKVLLASFGDIFCQVHFVAQYLYLSQRVSGQLSTLYATVLVQLPDFSISMSFLNFSKTGDDIFLKLGLELQDKGRKKVAREVGFPQLKNDSWKKKVMKVPKFGYNLVKKCDFLHFSPFYN